MNQVAAFQHGNAGEISERGIHEVKAIAHTRNARVRVEARKHRVAVASRWQRCVKHAIVARILEPMEVGVRRLRAVAAAGAINATVSAARRRRPAAFRRQDIGFIGLF